MSTNPTAAVEWTSMAYSMCKNVWVAEVVPAPPPWGAWVSE